MFINHRFDFEMFGYEGSTGNIRDFQLFLLVFQLFSRMSWPVRCSIFVRFTCSFTSHITISRCVRRSKETGFLLPQKQHFVNVPVRRQVNIDEQVLREFEENPNYSIRRVARTLGITRNMVHRIIKQCSNFFRVMKDHAFIFVKVFSYFTLFYIYTF